ncbi:MAG: hypothetical protein NTX44_13185 [Ignavibacteriales bacterium]|nr:hypothetical protein [Ignavibacteriales bacterium]
MKIKGLLVLSILVVLCFGLLWAFNGPGKSASEPQDQGQALVNALSTANHQIDWATASQLIANQKGSISPNLSISANAASRVTKGTRGGTFARSAIDQILAQPGVIGLRYYFAKNADGSPTIVLVGVNTQGQAMTSAAVMEMAAPCPPDCFN